MWILWTEVKTLCSKGDTTPQGSPRYKDIYAKFKLFDNTEMLGERHWANDAYINFMQYVEWDKEVCSDIVHWHWQARWEYVKDPSTVFMDVGKGLIKIPKDSYFSKKSTVSD